MVKIVRTYVYVFDDVQFGIDLREKRQAAGLTQKQVSERAGHVSSGLCNSLEAGTYMPSLMIVDFLAICALFDLHPFDYFDLQKVSENV